ncbi:MAG: ABC-2 transporter permease [Candidatus Delongbacteria bacterium]|jgi:hypothetical protein
MFKLIMADIKVLGNRIWQIPIGVFLFIFSFSFIPNLEEVYKIHHLIYSVLIPGLLTYELLRDEQKHGSESVFMTLPVCKKTCILGRYIVISLFCSLSIPVIYLSEYLHITMHAKESIIEFSRIGSISIGVLLVIYYTLPVYYYTKKLMRSMGASALFLTALLIITDILYSHSYRLSLDNNTLIWYFKFSGIIASLVLVLKVFEHFYKNIADRYTNDIIYTTIIFITIDRIAAFQNMLLNYISVNKYLEIFLKSEKHIGSYLLFTALSSKHGLDLIIVGISLLIVIFLLFVFHKNFNDKFNRNMILYILSPVILFHVFSFLISFHSMIFYYPGDEFYWNIHLLLIYMIFVVSIIVFIMISVRASIYLLKNDRRHS